MRSDITGHLARGCRLAGLCASLMAAATSAQSYGFYRYGNGRADYQNRYDLAGEMFPSQMGTPVVYDFSNIGGMATLPPGVTSAMLTTATANAGNAWEQWANVRFADTLGTSGTGLVRLSYDGNAVGAYAYGYRHPRPTQFNYAEVFLGRAPSNFTGWTAANLEWTIMHEMGHVLGLRDLYNDFAGSPYAEELIDHPVAGNALPERSDSGRRDNVMDRYDYNANNTYQGNPDTIIDNDEIAGVSWLWGSPYNQIITGDFANAWTGTANSVRATAAHHGDQNNPTLGYWDYRVSVATAGSIQPYVDIDFFGYTSFAATAFPTASVTYGGNQGGGIERFIISQVGWTGNLILSIRSQFTDERLVDAWVVGGRTDSFMLNPVILGRSFQSGNQWAKVFGPVPEPSTALLLGALAAVALKRRLRSRGTA